MAPIQAAEPASARGPAGPIDEVEPRMPGREPASVDAIDRIVATVAPPAPPTVLTDAPRFQAALDHARATAGAHGVTFAAVRDGVLLWTGSSGRERDGRTELVANTPLVIGSVTKTFVAAAILQLVDEGRLTLADPVRSHLPELRELSRSITVGQLLDHTSGLADLFNDETRRALEEHPERPWSSDEVLETLHEPWYEPGEGWAYANTNYYLLGLIVERLTGNTLAEHVGSRFVEPLDLEATAVIGDADDAALPPAWSTIFWGSGAMRATAADLARWGDALYGGDILTAEAEREMLDFNDHDYGLGVQRISARGIEGYGHTGLLNTYTTLLFHVEYADVTVALLVNRSHVDLTRMLTIRPPGGSSLLAIALGRTD